MNTVENPPNPLYKGECHFPPSRINLRDSNPVRGEMFIETGTTKHISSSVGVIPLIVWNDTHQISHQNPFPLDGGRLGWGWSEDGVSLISNQNRYNTMTIYYYTHYLSKGSKIWKLKTENWNQMTTLTNEFHQVVKWWKNRGIPSTDSG